MPALSNDQLEQYGLVLLAPNKGQSLGPFLITLFLDALFFGVLFMQSYKYFTHFRTDTRFNRVLAICIMLLATGATLLCMTWMYELFVLNYGTYKEFFSVRYLSWFYVFDCFAMILVQSFFAYRAFELTKRNYFILAGIGFFMVVAWVTGILVKVRGHQLGNSADPADILIKAYVYSWLGATLIADTAITVVILTVLIKKKTGWKVTDRLITRLVKLTFESQLPPTIVAISTACQYSALVDTAPYVSIPFVLLQSKIYAFALFHTLNSRSGLTGNQTDITVNTVSGFSGSGSSNKPKSVHHVNDPLKVTTETYTHSDQIDVVLQSWPIGSHFSNRQTDPEIQVDVERPCDDYDSKEHIVSTSHPFSNYERPNRTP